MARYSVGELVNHLFTVRINGAAATSGQVTGLTGRLYVDGTYDANATVTLAFVSNGVWRASYTVPSGLSARADLSLVIDMTVSSNGHSISFHDQVEVPLTTATIRDYLQSNTINVCMTSACQNNLISQIETGGVAAEQIAYEVLRAGVADAITNAGPLDRHSLGTLVLIASNADTTSVPGAITVRHPTTDAALFNFQIVTGAGCPIQSIT